MTDSVSGIFSSTMHAISQSLLIPVMLILAIFFIYALINMGILIAEYYKRKGARIDINQTTNQILNLKEKNSYEIIRILDNSDLLPSHKEVLITLANNHDQSPEFREAIALKMVEDEGIKAAKRLEKTDIIAKVSPAVGLMGTLIPLGPGLTALGAGDIQSLSQNLITAFDAAVLGMASAALAFSISKIRRRWYEEEISNLESLAECVLEILK